MSNLSLRAGFDLGIASSISYRHQTLKRGLSLRGHAQQMDGIRSQWLLPKGVRLRIHDAGSLQSHSQFGKFIHCDFLKSRPPDLARLRGFGSLDFRLCI